MKLYTIDGQTFKALPDPYLNMSPMTEELFEQLEQYYELFFGEPED